MESIAFSLSDEYNFEVSVGGMRYNKSGLTGMGVIGDIVQNENSKVLPWLPHRTLNKRYYVKILKL